MTQDAAQTQGQPTDATGERTGKSVRKVIGAAVKDHLGESLGEVHDLILDANDRVEMAILGFGGWLGFGEKLYPVPWKLLHHRGDGTFTLQLPKHESAKEHFAEAPHIEHHGPHVGQDRWWGGMMSATTRDRVHHFYGGSGF